MLLFVDEESAAFQTNATKDFMDGVQMLVVKHRHGKLNPSKVSRSLHVIQTISGTQHSRFRHTHVGAKQSSEYGFVSNVGVAARDFSHCAFSDFFWRQDAKLNTNDFGDTGFCCHVVMLKIEASLYYLNNI